MFDELLRLSLTQSRRFCCSKNLNTRTSRFVRGPGMFCAIFVRKSACVLVNNTASRDCMQSSSESPVCQVRQTSAILESWIPCMQMGRRHTPKICAVAPIARSATAKAHRLPCMFKDFTQACSTMVWEAPESSNRLRGAPWTPAPQTACYPHLARLNTRQACVS